MRIGTGVASLFFGDGQGLFGFGPGGGVGINVPRGSPEHDELQARALYIEQGEQKLLVVSFDLVSGSRLIHKVLLDALAKKGVTLLPGQLWVVGTHTHSGPGHYLGNLYDVFGQRPLLYREKVAREIARAGLRAACDATRAPVECRVGFARRALWGAGRNRSLTAFLRNFEGDPMVWRDRLPEVGPPPSRATPEEQAIDPRLTVLAFVAKDDGRPLATWATWCCHAASFPAAPLRAYHRDWPGVAVDLLEKVEKRVPFAMIHQAANGDVTALPSGERRIAHPIERVRHLGNTIGATWLAGFDDAAKAASEAPFELGFRPIVPRDLELPTFEIGQPVIVGSEEADPGFLAKAFGEAERFPWRASAQRPKLPALGPLQTILRRHPALRPSPEHPMWLLRLGSHVIFASPFEQTTMAARTTERALTEAWWDVRREEVTASPIGLVGDYAGYLTTAQEYDEQCYEGAHTIYGRDQREALEDVWRKMISEKPLDPSGSAFTRPEPVFEQRVAAIVAKL